MICFCCSQAVCLIPINLRMFDPCVCSVLVFRLWGIGQRVQAVYHCGDIVLLILYVKDVVSFSVNIRRARLDLRVGQFFKQ